MFTVLPQGHVLGVADRGRSPHTGPQPKREGRSLLLAD